MTFSGVVPYEAMARRRVLAHQRVSGTCLEDFGNISRDPNGDLEWGCRHHMGL